MCSRVHFGESGRFGNCVLATVPLRKTPGGWHVNQLFNTNYLLAHRSVTCKKLSQFFAKIHHPGCCQTPKLGRPGPSRMGYQPGQFFMKMPQESPSEFLQSASPRRARLAVSLVLKPAQL